MAHKGDTIANPFTGEKIVFLRTTEETGGELLQVEMHVEPHGFAPAEHVHPEQAEYFKIERGTIVFAIDGKATRLSAGQELTIPAGTPHVWWNPDDEHARMIIEFRPALQMAEFFETIWGLAQDGEVDPRSGKVGLLWYSLIARKYQRELRITQLSWPVQRLLFALLAPLAHLLGYRLPYPYPYARRHSPRPQTAYRDARQS